MKPNFAFLFVLLTVMGILLQSCTGGPQVEPAVSPETPAMVTQVPTTAGATSLPTSTVTAHPTIAESTRTPTPSLTPTLLAPSLTPSPTATVPSLDSWLITTENIARFTSLASLGSATLDQINLTVWSPDGLRLAVGGEKRVTMLDTATWDILWRIEFADAFRLQFSQDGSRLLVSGGEKSPDGVLLDSATGKILSSHKDQMAALSPDGNLLAAFGIRDALTSELIREMSEPKETTSANNYTPEVEKAFSQDGRKLVAGTHGSGFTAWDVASGEITYHAAGYDPYDDICNGMSATSDWMVVICAIPSNNYTKVSLQANFINLNRPNAFGRYTFPDVINYEYQHFALLPDQPLIAWADGEKITLYDLAAGFQYVRALPGLPANGSISFSPGKDDRRMAFWSERTLQIWDINAQKKLIEFGGKAITQIAFNPENGQQLAFGKDDGSVAVWDVAQQEQSFFALARAEGRVGLAFAPDGKGLVTSSADRWLRLWNLEAPDLVPLLEMKVPSSIYQFVYTPDGKKIAATHTYSYDVNLYSGSLDDTQPVQSLAIAAAQLSPWMAIAISPNGERMAVGNNIGTVEIYDTADWTLWNKADGLRRGAVGYIKFSPDSSLLAASTRGLWDLKNGDLLVKLDYSYVGVAISPDQCLFAAGRNDGTLQLWDLQTGQPLEPQQIFESGIADLAFSPDGRLLAVGSQNGEVAIWGMPAALGQPPAGVPQVRCGQ